MNYRKQYTLQNYDNLISSNHIINPYDFDDNFNQFNIDFVAKWQFAPASEISLGYKLGSTFFNNDIRSAYFDNLII